MHASVTRIAVLTAIAALAACQEAEIAETPDPVVRVATVRLAPLAQTRSYTGTVVPRREVAEAFRVGGKVVARLVDVGDRVMAGQVLARLDPADLSLELERAQAELAAAGAAATKAEADARRGRTLFEGGHIGQAALDDRLLAADEARSRREQAERAVALAENRMGYAELEASAAGAVSATSAEAGQVVAAGQTVMTIARLDEREVEVAIPESRLADLDGAKAEVTLWANDASYRARLREVAPRADPATRTYRARFAVPDADEAVRLGMTATISLTRGDPEPLAHVPLTALLEDGTGPVVFVVDPASRTLERRPVTIEAYEARNAIVRDGLAGGEKIVTLGVQKLRAGTTVRLAETQSASAE